MTRTRAGMPSSFSARVRPRLRAARRALRGLDAERLDATAAIFRAGRRAPAARARSCDAQKLDEAYLLRLEPDRMLHNFRVNAGLAPKAPVYGGWESVEPWIEIRCHGHTLGHYLTAAACMYESTGDARFAERVDYIVAELAECQAKTGGWLTAFPDGVAPLDRQPRGQAVRRRALVHHAQGAGRPARRAPASRQQAGARRARRSSRDWIDAACADVPDDRSSRKCSTANTAA